MKKYTILEVAKVLGVARKVIDKLVGDGEIETIKIGTRRFVLPRHLDAYLERIGIDKDVDAQNDTTLIDAAGHPWSPIYHSEKKTKTALGYWRKKRTFGNSRADILKAVDTQLKQSGCKKMTSREGELMATLLEVLGH